MANTFIYLKRQFFVAALAGLTLSTAGCNSSWTDPFALPPTGKTITVMPRVVSAFSLDESSLRTHPSATIFSVRNSADLLSSRSGNGGVGVADGVKISSIAMTDRSGKIVTFSMDQIRESNRSAACQGVAKEVEDLIRLDKSMSLICDNDFVTSIPAAVTIRISTDDNQQREFTSWGTSWSEMGGTQLTIYSFNL